MVADIFVAMGPFNFLLASVIVFFVLLLASSWFAYFVARSFKRGLLA